MAPKNIDETIRKLLNAYAKRCNTVLHKDLKALHKRRFFAENDREEAFQEYTKEKNALLLLEKIAKNPKKYLYSGKDLVYADGDLYNKLSPILSARFDKSKDKHLLVRLSEKIAHHVNYGKNDYQGVWVFYDEGGRDLEAEAIINMNKSVQLWNSNDLVAAIKDFAPASAFAVDLHKRSK